MRFKLTLFVNRKAFGDLLPINYQYEQSAAIYKILSKANIEFANWLHDNGYQLENNKRFKLFTFSRFKIEKRQLLPYEHRLKILSDTVEWQITFLPEIATEKFIQGIFSNQTFEIGDILSTVQFHVQSIEVLSSPDFEKEMEFSTMSPMCIKALKDGCNNKQYISPDEPQSKGAILIGLISKYKAFYGKDFIGKLDFDFNVMNEPKSVLVTIKAGTPQQTKVRGYMCKFRMKAPKELMRIAYESGIGEECSQGFGCVRVINYI